MHGTCVHMCTAAPLRSALLQWNLVANMLYLTHPTGVGYSYSEGDGANVHTDESDGADNAAFLRKWFAAYPEYLANDFWLTGESVCASGRGQRQHTATATV